MKKILFSVLFFFLLKSNFAQSTYIPFPDSVSEWTYYTINADGFNDFYANFETVRMEGDTIINGLNYKKLSGAFNGALREANKVVYAISFQAPSNWSFCPVNQEFVLYNFNVGDSVIVRDTNHPDNSYVVELSDSTNISGMKHYVYNGNYKGNIEGIGSQNSFLSLARFIPFEYSSSLVCFKDFKRNITYSYEGDLTYAYGIYGGSYYEVKYPYRDCYYFVGEEELVKKSRFEVFPNPVQNELRIKGLSDITQVQVQDLMGKTLLSQTINPNQSLNLNGLSKGIYFLNFTDKAGKNMGLTKIVKE